MSETPENPIGPTPESPPKPRKLPQQSRSRILVGSIKQACMMILESEGPSALTLMRISDVSGVAIGSIYQYFPNVDAIVALLYEDLANAEIETAIERARTQHPHSLENYLASLISGTLSFHSRMLRLDKKFHQRFYRTFDLTSWYNHQVGDPQASPRVIERMLREHIQDYPARDPEMEAATMTYAFQGAIQDAIKYHPHYIDSPEFAKALLRMALGLLSLQPQNLKEN